MRINRTGKLREICGERVLFLRSKNVADMTKVLSFNDTSNFLWETLQGKDFTINDLVEALTGTYDVTEEIARQDGEKWINQMKELGLVDD